MLFKHQTMLEIQWDDNWYKDQNEAYHLKLKVEKIKFYGNNLFNLFKPFSVFSPRREGKKVMGEIIQSNIEIKEKKLCLDLPRSVMKDICKGDLLSLSISEKGWCIHFEKINQ